MNDITAKENPGEAPAAVVIPKQPFGVYLREAREASGMTTAEVADRMKLSEDIVRALEESNLNALPSPAFTQGYIKGYVRLLKIPLEDVMHAYDQMVPQKVQALTPSANGKHVQRSHDGAIKWMTYGLVGVALLLIAVWWQQSGMQWLEKMAPLALQEPESASQSLDVPSSSVATTTETLTIEEAPVEVTVEVPEQVLQAPANVPAIPVSKKVEKLPESRSVAVTGVTPVPAGSDLLVLTATDQSWTEVQDADGNRLFFELMEAGDEQRIKGRAPFRIFLGNAPVITIKMNDQPVDIRGYVRQNRIAHVSISAKAVAQTAGRHVQTQVSDQFIPAAENNND